MKISLLFFAIFTLFFCERTQAQSATVTPYLKYTHGAGWKDSLLFPRVTLPTTDATMKANLALEAIVLYGIAPEKGFKKLFDANTYTKNGSGISAMSYSIVRNDGVLLSLHIVGETMAAYPDHFDHSVTFDIATGSVVTARDILTEEGFKKLRTLVTIEDKKLIAVDSVEISKDTSIDHEDFRYNLDQLYVCIDSYDLDPIAVSESAITTAASACLPHAAAVEDIGWGISVPIAKLSSDLSDYGKSVLIQKQARAFTPSDSAAFKFFHGTVGSTPITMMIWNTEGTDNVQYFYDDKASAITLTGGLNGHDFKVGTFEKAGAQETFDGTLNNGSIKGTWRKGKKSQPFELHSY